MEARRKMIAFLSSRLQQALESCENLSHNANSVAFRLIAGLEDEGIVSLADGRCVVHALLAYGLEHEGTHTPPTCGSGSCALMK
jgi:hypothetical protein